MRVFSSISRAKSWLSCLIKGRGGTRFALKALKCGLFRVLIPFVHFADFFRLGKYSEEALSSSDDGGCATREEPCA